MADKNKKTGNYIRLADQYKLIELTLEVDPTTWVVCHIFRPRDKRCRQLENHLKILATKHPEIKFCAGLRVMDAILGYTELLDGDDFSTEMIEKRIAESGAIELKADLKEPANVKPKKNKRRSKKKSGGDDKNEKNQQN